MAKVATAYVDIDARLDKLKHKLKTFDPELELDLDIDRQAVQAQLVGLRSDLWLDVDIGGIWAQLGLAHFSIDINAHLDATTVAALQAQLAALAAQANSVG